jgi:hypothetical protein
MSRRGANVRRVCEAASFRRGRPRRSTGVGLAFVGRATNRVRSSRAVCRRPSSVREPSLAATIRAAPGAANKFFRRRCPADTLPTPYAPKSNPADGIWRYVKYGKLPNYTPPALGALRTKIVEELERLRDRPEILKSFIRFTKLPINL